MAENTAETSPSGGGSQPPTAEPQGEPPSVVNVPASQPGQPSPANQPNQPPPPPGYQQPGQPPPPPGYQQPGQPPPPPGYQQPGQPPPPPGYNPGLQNIGTAGIAAQNLPQTQVTWMPAPPTAPPNCPPGLEYLSQIDQILVHQQIELLELVTNFETENKYRIRNSLGQQVYFAAEHSSVFQRQCCGPGRAFSMSISDNQQREVIHLERPLQCHCNCYGLTCYCCCSCCAPREIEVQSPPGTVVGYVRQDPWGILKPKFFITNADGEVVLKITGPTLGCSCFSDANFVVIGKRAKRARHYRGVQIRISLVTGVDGVTEVGKVTKQWGGFAKEYLTDADNFGIQFPMDLDVKIKAVLLGACFLIDFMFFEQPANNQNRRRRR